VGATAAVELRVERVIEVGEVDAASTYPLPKGQIWLDTLRKFVVWGCR
jgi:hypothetical protein